MKKAAKHPVKRKTQQGFSKRVSRVFSWIQENVHITGTFFVQAFFVIAIFAVIGRLYSLQVVNGAEYRDQLMAQHSNVDRGQRIRRGDIFFKSKDDSRVLAATTKITYTLAVNPNKVTNAQALYDAANQIVTLEQGDFIKKAEKENDPYEEVAKKLSEEQVQLLKNIEEEGLVFVKNEERYYPGGELGSPVLGFMSYTNDEYIGSYGVEKYYDQLLRRNGSHQSPSLFASIFSRGEPSVSEQDENQSNIKKEMAKEASLILTIEPAVQAYLEQELRSVTEKWSAKYAAGVIMDPRTGEIIAMGTSDGFDLNGEIKHYRNYLIEDRLELGSIIKPLTVAIGLETGAIDINFSYNDTGLMTLNRRTISNFDGKGRGPGTDLQKVLTNSLNTGVATIALKVGIEDYRNWIKKIGFGEETGIDLPGEVYGLIENLENNREIEIATASFGQGIAITPIEALRALGSIANGGKLVTPYVVDTIEYGDLIPSKNSIPGGTKQVFSKETTKEVTKLMVNIVDESSTFSPYKNPDYAVGIKTGTAQTVQARGGYSPDKFLHSFVGFFPAYAEKESPKFIVLLYIVEPIGAQYSSTTLKETFFNLSEFLIHYFDVPPDRLNRLKDIDADNFS